MRNNQYDEGVNNTTNDGDDDNAATGVAASVQITSMVVIINNNINNNNTRNHKDNHGLNFAIGIHTDRANNDGACQILGLAGRGDGAGHNDACCTDDVLGISKYVYINIYIYL